MRRLNIILFFPPNFYSTVIASHGDKITIEQLLNHTSGVKSYTSIPAWLPEMHKPITVSGLIDVFKEEPLNFEPGTRFSYSNSGYILLGAIVKKASGIKYEDFIEKKVFAKAGLKNSFYGRDNVAVKNAVNGYMLDEDRHILASPISMTQPYAAGSLISSVDDLYQWNQAIFTGKVINQKSMDKAFTGYKLPSGKSTNYGYGWMPQSLLGVKTIGHGGEINGFSAMAIMAPDQNTFVVVF